MTVATAALFTGALLGVPPRIAYPPTDDSWTRHGTIIEANQAWENDSLHEPSVLVEDGVFRVWYGGGWDTQAIGYAECSSDPTVPANWTKNVGPIWGGGGSSIAGERNLPEVMRLVDGTYYGSAIAEAYEAGQSMVFATSPDGLEWTEVAGSISLPAGRTLWGNRVVWQEGDDWFMLAEAGQWVPPWGIHYYTSSDGLTWSIGNGGNALTDLQVAAGGMFGGPSFFIHDDAAMPEYGGIYHLWYHASPTASNLPTNIYHSTSTDKVTWATPTLVLEYLGTGDEVDQVADPQVIDHAGTVYLIYDANDNVNERATLAIATAS